MVCLGLGDVLGVREGMEGWWARRAVGTDTLRVVYFDIFKSDTIGGNYQIHMDGCYRGFLSALVE